MQLAYWPVVLPIHAVLKWLVRPLEECTRSLKNSSAKGQWRGLSKPTWPLPSTRELNPALFVRFSETTACHNKLIPHISIVIDIKKKFNFKDLQQLIIHGWLVILLNFFFTFLIVFKFIWIDIMARLLKKNELLHVILSTYFLWFCVLVNYLKKN